MMNNQLTALEAEKARLNNLCTRQANALCHTLFKLSQLTPEKNWSIFTGSNYSEFGVSLLAMAGRFNIIIPSGEPRRCKCGKNAKKLIEKFHRELAAGKEGK
ncbi:MAG: hypothetical protein IKO72_08960 [Kiritimatiellae bacterium]|nr:hypothetical protein [Kiritimatiellia bacterium]